jgi:hypothetical protein
LLSWEFHTRLLQHRASSIRRLRRLCRPVGVIHTNLSEPYYFLLARGRASKTNDYRTMAKPLSKLSRITTGVPAIYIHPASHYSVQAQRLAALRMTNTIHRNFGNSAGSINRDPPTRSEVKMVSLELISAISGHTRMGLIT